MLVKTANLVKSGDFGEIQPIAKVVGEMIRANKLTQLERPRNVGEFSKSGDFGDISPELSTK